VQGALQDLPWAGDVYGFTEDEPVTRLADYLSDKWLSMVHVNQQLDLLCWELLRSGVDQKCEVVNLAFFLKLLEMYRTWETKPYNAERQDAHCIWAVGEELAEDVHSWICGMVNVKNSHWITAAVEVPERVVWCGDTLEDSNREGHNALEWCIHQHVPQGCCQKDLPITSQIDMHSCSVLGINAA
jgi:hypothetical protein